MGLMVVAAQTAQTRTFGQNQLLALAAQTRTLGQNQLL